VVFHNLYPYGSAGHGVVASTIRLIANMGWVGVQWFFVLSGFLITGILMRLKDVKGGLKNFYLRRILRIFPVYYLTLATFIFALPIFGYVLPQTTTLIALQAWYWFYLNNWIPLFVKHDPGFPHLWSLAVEEQFYFIWPWLVLYLTQRWIVAVCIFCVISAPIIRYLFVQMDEHNANDLAYVLTIVRWDALAIGALFAFAIENYHYKKLIEIAGSTFTIGILVLFLVIVIANRSFAPAGQGFLALNQTVAALLGVVLLNECLNGVNLFKGRLDAFFLLPFMRLLGKYSYAIYVFHLIIHFMLSPYVENFKINNSNFNSEIIDFSALALNVIAAFILASISWRLIERPLLVVKHRIPAM
jgi:peptidoglycan/LPS O-acetylase OafA/YrhL